MTNLPVQAQGAGASAPPVAAAPSSPAKKQLIARVLELQRPGIEAMGRSLAEQPAVQIMQQAGAVLQRMPADKREAVGREVEADLRKYVEEAAPLVRDRAVRLAPSTIGALLEEKFTEDELRQYVTMLESPVYRRFQETAPEMQRAISQQLVAETRGLVEPKVRALEQSVAKRLGVPAGPAASGPRR